MQKHKSDFYDYFLYEGFFFKKLNVKTPVEFYT